MNENGLTLEEKMNVVQSLCGGDSRLIEFIPHILKDLFELGSSPKYAVDLLNRNFMPFINSWNVLELCCGKGSVILSIVEKFGCRGIGVDLFEPFILEAISIAWRRQLNKNVCFEVMDIKKTVKILSGFDLVIFGFDSDKLGNEIESLQAVSKCCKKNGFVLIESSQINIARFEEMISESGLLTVDKVIHSHEEMKKVNMLNTRKIKKRIYELERAHPEHQQLFENYLKAQEDECSELENSYITSTYLLQVQ